MASDKVLLRFKCTASKLRVRCVHLISGGGVLGMVVYNEGGTCPCLFHKVGVAYVDSKRLLSTSMEVVYVLYLAQSNSFMGVAKVSWLLNCILISIQHNVWTGHEVHVHLHCHLCCSVRHVW